MTDTLTPTDGAIRPAHGRHVDVIVTRHPALRAFLAERGITADRVIDHATAEDVRGRRVAGVLPIPLAAKCASVVWVELRLRPQDRGVELDLDAMRERVVAVREFSVTELPDPLPDAGTEVAS